MISYQIPVLVMIFSKKSDVLASAILKIIPDGELCLLILMLVFHSSNMYENTVTRSL